jgi:hypothetical protein
MFNHTNGWAKRLVVSALVATSLWSVGAMAAVRVSITDVSPASPIALSARTSLYARVVYDSDQPLKLQAAGWRGGREVKAAMCNASQTYPAGHGVGLVWVAYDAGGRIDQIRAVAYDNRWRPVTEASVPVKVEWVTQARPAAEAPWVRELGNEQTRVISQGAQNYMSGPLGWVLDVLVMAMLLSVPGYPVLQIIAFWRLRGAARLFSAVPLIVMLPTYAFCLYALSRESNLWPIWAIFLSPPMALYEIILFLIFRRGNHAPPLPEMAGS